MAEPHEVHREMRAGVEVFRLRAGEAVAEVIPAWGLNCIAFRAGEPVLEPASFEEIRARPTGYGIPILFPFPNRVRDGVFGFRGRRYPVDPARHGFVRDKAWQVAGAGASDEEGAWVAGRIDAADHPEGILAQFPFPFRLQATYRVSEGGLQLEARVENTGGEEMPWGLGIHPYFRLPARGTLQVPARRRWELAEALPTGRLLEVEGVFDLSAPRALAGLSLDDIFTDLIADDGGRVRCVLGDDDHEVETVVEFSARLFPHLVVYTPPPPRRAICIEPYTCVTDAFNLHERGLEGGLRVLRPGEETALTVRIAARRRQGRPA